MPSCQNFHTTFALNNSGKCRMDDNMVRSVLGWIIVHSNACQPSTYSTWSPGKAWIQITVWLSIFINCLNQNQLFFLYDKGDFAEDLFFSFFLNEKHLKYLIDKSISHLGHGESYCPVLGQFRFVWGSKHYLYPGDSDPADLCASFGETVKGRRAWGNFYLDERFSTSGI